MIPSITATELAIDVLLAAARGYAANKKLAELLIQAGDMDQGLRAMCQELGVAEFDLLQVTRYLTEQISGRKEHLATVASAKKSS